MLILLRIGHMDLCLRNPWNLFRSLECSPCQGPKSCQSTLTRHKIRRFYHLNRFILPSFRQSVPTTLTSRSNRTPNAQTTLATSTSVATKSCSTHPAQSCNATRSPRSEDWVESIASEPGAVRKVKAWCGASEKWQYRESDERFNQRQQEWWYQSDEKWWI